MVFDNACFIETDHGSRMKREEVKPVLKFSRRLDEGGNGRSNRDPINEIIQLL